MRLISKTLQVLALIGCAVVVGVLMLLCLLSDGEGAN